MQTEQCDTADIVCLTSISEHITKGKKITDYQDYIPLIFARSKIPGVELAPRFVHVQANLLSCLKFHPIIPSQILNATIMINLEESKQLNRRQT